VEVWVGRKGGGEGRKGVERGGEGREVYIDFGDLINK
jgi:hypothetical protein